MTHIWPRKPAKETAAAAMVLEMVLEMVLDDGLGDGLIIPGPDAAPGYGPPTRSGAAMDCSEVNSDLTSIHLAEISNSAPARIDNIAKA